MQNLPRNHILQTYLHGVLMLGLGYSAAFIYITINISHRRTCMKHQAPTFILFTITRLLVHVGIG